MDRSDEDGEALEGFGVSCRFVLDDLSATSDEELSGREMEPYAKLGLVLFKYGAAREVLEHLTRYGAEIRALISSEHGPALWGVLVDYTWYVNPHLDHDAFIETLRPIVGQEGERTMLTIAEKLKIEGHSKGLREGLSKGHSQGHSQGLSQGLSQGQRAIVLQQLARRFGPLSPETEERVARADTDELQRWALRLLDAGSLDEVFAPA